MAKSALLRHVNNDLMLPDFEIAAVSLPKTLTSFLNEYINPVTVTAVFCSIPYCSRGKKKSSHAHFYSA